MVSSIIAGIGALNWGLVGITAYAGFRFDLVEAIASLVPPASFHIQNIVYIVVGIAAVVMFVGAIMDCKKGMMHNKEM